MKIPKIEFRFSWIYLMVHGNKKSFNDYDMQSNLIYINEIESIWNKISKTILKEMSKITKLNWQEDKIICYINSSQPFSDPLTIPKYKNKSEFIDVLVHELFHQIFIQGNNSQSCINSWNYFNNKYETENKTVRIHIILLAFLAHIYINIFNDESKIKKEIEFYKLIKAVDYVRAWEIVLDEGYKNIIDDFINKK